MRRFVAQEGVDEFRGIHQGMSQEPQGDQAAMVRHLGQTHEGAKKGVNDLGWFQGTARRFGFQCVQLAQAFVAEAVQPAPDHFPYQSFLGAKMVIHRRQAHLCLAGNLAHGGSLIAMGDENAFGGVENAFTAIVSVASRHIPPRLEGGEGGSPCADCQRVQGATVRRPMPAPSLPNTARPFSPMSRAH